MKIRIKRKTAKIVLATTIMLVALALIFSMVIVVANESNSIVNNTLPNMSVGQKSPNIIQIGSSTLNVSWEHINTYNLTKQEFILKVSQTSNSSTANQLVTISPYLYLTNADFNLTDLPANSIQTTAYQYAPSVAYYYNLTNTTTCELIGGSNSSIIPFTVYDPYHPNQILYYLGDIVSYNGNLYEEIWNPSIYNSNGLPPDSPSFWKDLGPDTSSNSTNETWNNPECNQTGQIITTMQVIPYSDGSLCTQQGVTCTPFNITTYNPVQIGSSSINSTASMFQNVKEINNSDGSTTYISNMSMYQMQVPAYSNTPQGTKYFKIIINNVPVNYTNGIHSTGTFIADIGGNLIWDKTHSSWWNNSFSYYKPITITETSGSTINNYSLLIHVPYDAHMNSDFSDLRFIDSDNTTKLGYALGGDVVSTYIWSNGSESTLSTTAGSSTDVIIRIPTLTASSTKTIYMYYGDSGATSESSPSNAFVFYDDFSEGYDTNVWQDITGGLQDGYGHWYPATPLPNTPYYSLSNYLYLYDRYVSGNKAYGIETKQTFNISANVFAAKISSSTTSSAIASTSLYNFKGWEGVNAAGSYTIGVLNSPYKGYWKSPYSSGTSLISSDTSAHTAFVYGGKKGQTKAGLVDTQNFITPYISSSYPVLTPQPLLIANIQAQVTSGIYMSVYWAMVFAHTSSDPTYSMGSEVGGSPSPSDSCTYSGSGNWAIVLGDSCNIQTNTDLTGYNITFSGTGNITFNSTITVCKVGGLPSNQRGFLGNNAIIKMGVC